MSGQERKNATCRLAAVACALLLLFLAAAPLAGSASDRRPEYEVKAAFLYQFAKFLTWPDKAFETPTSPIVLGVVGKDPFDGMLEKVVNGKSAQGRAIVVRSLKWSDDLAACRILFVPAGETEHFASVASKLRKAGVLTVGEDDNFTESGGVIRFTLEEKRIGLEIDVDWAQDAGLTISAQLLKLATIRHGRRNN